ncbi:hypothetical protein LCGC14_1649880 [marine sediment metagenome]|uniref:Uncharacterized protein n=1 Tax=marine sediment metagenome TaxID=412755 RepID=A0A0F9KD14_9ZZZZ
MTQKDKIKLIKKQFDNYYGITDGWVQAKCLLLLKDYDKLKKAHRIDLLAGMKTITDKDVTMVTCPKFDGETKTQKSALDDLL